MANAISPYSQGRQPCRTFKRREDVPELQRDGSVVSQLRADSPCGRLGDVPGREEVGRPRDRAGAPRLLSDGHCVAEHDLIHPTLWYAPIESVVGKRIAS